MGEQYFKGVMLMGSIRLQRERGFSRRGLSGGGGGRGEIESNEALWRKRLSFEYEHEVRGRDITEGGLSPTPPEFILLPVSLEELIDSVFVPPMAEPWLKDVEVDGLKKYGLGKGGSFRDGGLK